MSFWRNKKVLITGADGFVGSNLAKALLRKKSKVYTFSRRGITKPSLLILEGLVESIAGQEKGSVRDFDRLNNVIKKHKIDFIYHLAAQPLVEIGQESPLLTFEVNIKGTWNVLEAARKNHVKKVIIASTVHVYGDNPNLPYREEYFPQPSRPYETSKACADLLAQSYANTYNLPVEIPRFVNLYGPGDFNFNRIIPKLMRALIKGENPKVWDTGAVRDFLYIGDAIEAYLALGEKQLSHKKRLRVINFGSGNPVKIIDLARKIIALEKKRDISLSLQRVPTERNKEIKKQYVSIKRAQSLLDWKPKIRMFEGLKKTINWYKTHI